MLILAVCGFFLFQGFGFHSYQYPIPAKKKKKFPTNQKTTKKNQKKKYKTKKPKNKTGHIHSLMLKMSHNEFPTRVIPAHDADAPGQYCGWI